MSLTGSTPRMADVILAAIDASRRSLHTALPGKVLEYDAATQTATVQPMVQASTQDEDGYWGHEDLPEIYDVPVQFMRSPSFTLTFPIPVGTTGLLVFCERDIGQWRYTGQSGSPGDQRCHSLAGAVFFPTMAPNSEVSAVSAANVVLEPKGSAIVQVGSEASHFVADASAVSSVLTALKNAISSAPTTPGDGGAAFKAALVSALAAWPSSVATTKLKSE